MTEKASADDFQVQDFLKKKKKKKKYKEHKEHENDERESIQVAELSSASPPLLEDQAAQSGEGFKKEKRKKKKEKQQSLLGNSCVELESDINNETGVDASQKKKKKKKWKHNDNTDEESNAVSCIAINQSCSDICQEIDTDYVYLKLPVKKKRKEKLPEEDEVCELPESTYLEAPVEVKERKEKMPEEDEVGELPESIYLEPHKKKKKRKEKLPEEDEVCDLPESTYLEAPVEVKERKEKLPEEDEVGDLPESTFLEAPVKVKKRKEKLPEEDEVGDLPESTFLEAPVKVKKRKEKLPEQDEVCDLPESTYLEAPVKMKKRKEKLPEEDGVCDLPESIYLEAPVKKKKGKEKLPEEDEVCELPESTYLEAPVEVKERKEKLPEQDEVGELPGSTYLEPPVKKKKRKEKLPEEDGVCELPECIYLEPPVKKKKRKEKLPEEDEVHELPTSETHDKNGSKRSKSKNKTCSSTLDTQEAADVTVDQSLLSPAEQNGQGKGTELPVAAEAGGVASSQQRHEDGDCDASPARREDSMVVPANLSKLTKAAHHSSKERPVRPEKIKSRAYITEESSSDSDVTTPAALAWEPYRRQNQNSSFTRTGTTGDGSKHHDDDDDDDDDEEYLNFPVMDLDTAKQELEEFIPHVRNISEHTIMKIALKDLARFKEFKKQGIPVRFGRFSEKENNQIRKNIAAFLELTGIDSAEKLLFTSRYPEEKKAINRLKLKHLFFEKISEGIPRLWTLIYYRARKIFDPHNYKGRYTNEEKEKLKQCYALHGNDWRKISEMMCRSNLSVAMKYSEIKSHANYGPWSKEEVRKLMCAVEEVIRKRLGVEDGRSNRDILIDREKLFQKFPWTEIETKVGTRYWRQCKQKWITILTNKLGKGRQLWRGTKGLQVRINFIKRLRELNVEDSSEVKWEEFSDIMGGAPRDYVQANFYKLKISSVPLWRKKTFSEIIEYLYETTLPALEEKLEREKGNDPSPDNSEPEQQKQVFLLSDIFDTSEEDQLIDCPKDSTQCPH
ncbi:transcription termination factor 1 [Neopsephotus bourkii]|uniref:transcription termination factor 1 n=1 Tax=Neopsephotus bourkii TaxID=309878 RepID=UPI002AA59B7D|nr:transcription termination factor 1 [Neopsephotus bourkii]